MIFSNNMEDSEALSTLALVRRAGIAVVTATKEEDLLVRTAFGTEVYADFYLKTLDLNQFDFLLIPGGKYVNEVIRDDIEIGDAINHFYEKKQLIGAICAAPAFLIKEHILDGKRFTAFPGTERNASESVYEKTLKVVVDSNIITARSAGAVIDFSYEIVKKIKGNDAAKALLEEILY